MPCGKPNADTLDIADPSDNPLAAVYKAVLMANLRALMMLWTFVETCSVSPIQYPRADALK